MKAYIGAINFLDDAIITTNKTMSPGFPIENSVDYKTATSAKYGDSSTGGWNILFDLGANKIPNYIGIVGFRGQTVGSEIRVSWSNIDGAGPWNDVLTYALSNRPQEDIYNVFFRKLPDLDAKRYWRVRITNSGPGDIVSHISLGTVTPCKPIGTGFRPPIYEHYDSINAQSNAANYLGRSIKRKPMNLAIKQQGIASTELRANWVPFLKHAALKPFFFSWDYENYPDEAVYCWTEKPQQPVYSSLCSASINLKVKAIIK